MELFQFLAELFDDLCILRITGEVVPFVRVLVVMVEFLGAVAVFDIAVAFGAE